MTTDMRRGFSHPWQLQDTGFEDGYPSADGL